MKVDSLKSSLKFSVFPLFPKRYDQTGRFSIQKKYTHVDLDCQAVERLCFGPFGIIKGILNLFGQDTFRTPDLFGKHLYLVS